MVLAFFDLNMRKIRENSLAAIGTFLSELFVAPAYLVLLCSFAAY
jgi:hypothetical protein